MAAARTPALAPIRPLNTEYGTGYLPRVFRSMVHPAAMYLGLAMNWPLTNGQLAANIQLGLDGVTADIDPNDITSQDAKTGITTWLTQITAIHGVIAGLPADETPNEDTKRLITDAYAHAFALLAVLDKDLLGITSDGGRFL